MLRVPEGFVAGTLFVHIDGRGCPSSRFLCFLENECPELFPKINLTVFVVKREGTQLL